MQTTPRIGIDYMPDDYRPPPPKPWPLWVQLILFALIFATLQWGWSSARGTAVERVGVDVATVQPAAWLIQQLSPEIQAQAAGSRIRAQGGGINILNGCEGFEVLFLLVAALLVAPLAWRHRFIGLLAAVPIVWVLNQGRILVLFYAYRADKELFALLHGTVAPLVMIVLIGAIFTLFLAALRVPQQPSV